MFFRPRPALPSTPPSPRGLWHYAGMGAMGLLALMSVEQALRCWRAWKAAESPPFEPYQRRATEGRRRVLVVGDSTGVGVGAADAADSVAGLLAAEYGDAELVNLSVSGACIVDMPRQLEQLGEGAPAFDLVLLHIGGNDIMRMPKLATLEPLAEQLMAALQKVGRRVIWLGPGDVGVAPLFRPPFSWWLSRRTRQACEMFHRVAARHGVEYVGFHGDPHRELFAQDRERYFAVDGIHPSSHAYRYCYGWLMRSSALAQAFADAAEARVEARADASAMPPAGPEQVQRVSPASR
ncbi:MAG TPA: GDSL-type esterase/lipase family protein [Ideonella sp.]|nr:GDSL-type esterase/lipase family protein [Ideonella sp.]